MKKSVSPLLLLLAINLLAGLLTFRNYGLSWDEPLFYDYADSIWRAYTPAAFSPGFDFESVYGRSAEDHKIYGPAYLLLARPLQRGIQALTGADMAAAWHLVNFLTFQIGLIGFYRLARRWLDPWPAALATAFLAWQPVFWGHAFINPKDIPFLVFFLWALTLGLEMVDTLTDPAASARARTTRTLLAALVLGLASAIRVIGPLAGALTGAYFLLKMFWKTAEQPPRLPHPLPPLPQSEGSDPSASSSVSHPFSIRFSPWLGFAAYGLLAIAVMIAAWPYLWADPAGRLAGVLRHMSDNPTELAVLFLGQIFRANDMPRRYLPTMLTLTLTEPVWFVFAAGMVVAIRRIVQKRLDFRAPLVVLSLFGGMMAYLLYFVPAMYDGFRHFFFLLPPVFLFCGFALQAVWENRRRLPLPAAGQNAAFGLAAGLLLLSGLLGIVRLHPYEYAYYNRFAGGVGGAYRVYETEYWLTCYKEAIEWVKYHQPAATLHIQREFPIAAYYADGLNIKDLAREPESEIRPGDLMLFHTRANLDIRSIYRGLPVVARIGREGADFCLIKRKD